MDNNKIKLFTAHELSFAVNDPTRTLRGYAAKYYDPNNAGTRYSPTDSVEIRMQHGCFDKGLRENKKIHALWSHDTKSPLGVTGANLKLEADHIGLRFELALPETTLGLDTWILAGGTGGPKILQGCSFGATRGEKGGDNWTKEGTTNVWTFTSWAKLREITLTQNPAFESTGVSFDDEAARWAAREMKFNFVNTLTKK